MNKILILKSHRNLEIHRVVPGFIFPMPSFIGLVNRKMPSRLPPSELLATQPPHLSGGGHAVKPAYQPQVDKTPSTLHHHPGTDSSRNNNNQKRKYPPFKEPFRVVGWRSPARPRAKDTVHLQPCVIIVLSLHTFPL